MVEYNQQTISNNLSGTVALGDKNIPYVSGMNYKKKNGEAIPDKVFTEDGSRYGDKSEGESHDIKNYSLLKYMAAAKQLLPYTTFTRKAEINEKNRKNTSCRHYRCIAYVWCIGV